MVEVVGVRFKKAGKTYYFAPGEFKLSEGQRVIVETVRGLEIGDITLENKMIEESDKPLSPVVRLATEKDEEEALKNKEKEKTAFGICEEKIKKHGLEMTLVDVEYTFDNSKIIFFFVADGRIDFRELVKDLAAVFKTRIELHQIGVRDETKLKGGLGMCGRPVCCKTFLSEFMPVSLKMASDQCLSTNPQKISGTCGKLVCCLNFEQEAYEDAFKSLPRVGSLVSTPDGIGTVTEANVLKEQVKVRLDGESSNIKTYEKDMVCLKKESESGFSEENQENSKKIEDK